MATDVVVTTHNRFSYLKQTVEHILERTRTPYRLHVIDDGSAEGNADWLWDLFKAGKIFSLVLRKERVGVCPNWNAGVWLGFSDPIVFTDDDVLCPDVEPDWLARGLAAMENHPEIGVLALNNPGGNPKNARRKRCTNGEITLCRFVGGTFMFIRRSILRRHPLDHRKGSNKWPTQYRCNASKKDKLRIAYLTDTYCQHIGEVSVLRRKGKFPYKIMPVQDLKTLRPSEEWAW